MDSMSEQKMQEKYVRPFRIYLQLERGLSPNTLDAYMRDLDKLLSFLAEEGKDPLTLTIDDLHAFAAALSESPVSITKRFTPYLFESFTRLSVPRQLFFIASFGEVSISGTCLCAAA